MKGLLETLDSYLDKKLQEIHTAMPGRVVKVDGNMLDIQPELPLGALKSVITAPVIFSCPLVQNNTMHGGVSQKIENGACGLLVICESDISAWKLSGNKNVSPENRFALQNSVFIPGLYPKNEATYTEDLGKAGIALWAAGEETIAIYNGVSSMKKELENIYELINDFFTKFLTMMNAALPVNPMGGPVFAQLAGEMPALQQKLGELKTNIAKIFVEKGG